ncbi:nucleobase:cation symporter-2 family protein [Lentzea rhizosphaerae]|uniref:Nucleobase:cation symporter-2 family protein n=1 Tax=Lentzea rhizosphaerae TaxID=2041025 RepID=A0ABV8BJZ9_9PSEU
METALKHPVDQVLPPARLGLLGLQHVLAMYTGCVTVPLVFGAAAGLDTRTIGLLVNADLLVAGLITVLQALGIGTVLGIRLPVVAGATFTAVTPMILIAGQYGVQAVYGSMLAAGVFGILIAVPFARAVRFFPPVVTGSVITVIGLSLIGVGAGLITGQDGEGSGRELGLAFGIVLVIVLVGRFARGLLGQLGVLIGLVGGTIAAILLGLTDFSGVGGAAWLGIAQPFHFGPPQFPLAAVVSMCVVMLVTFTESTASVLAVGEMTGRPVTSRDLARGLAAEGVSGVLGGVMNGFLDTVFGQNVGLVGITKARSRYVAAVAGAILVLLGLIPKLGAVVAALPGPVVGAAGLVMFATVAALGIAILRGVDFENTGNLLIVAVTIGVGLLPVVAPKIYQSFPAWAQVIGGSAITSAALTAFVLNLLFNHTRRGI